MRKSTHAKLRATVRCSVYLGYNYKPSGALKIIRHVENQLFRLPNWLVGPAFYMMMLVIEFTPLGTHAKMDLLAERLYPTAGRSR
jgi:hypothetical protein